MGDVKQFIVRDAKDRVAVKIFTSAAAFFVTSKGYTVEPAVSLLEPSAPYQPRDGDEITISRRGRVEPSGGGWIMDSLPDRWFDEFDFAGSEQGDGWVVEVHKRGPEPKPNLPTTPGSVILTTGGLYLVLQEDGLWCDDTVESLDRVAWRVIYDAGAS